MDATARRAQVATLHKQGLSQRAIAKQFNVSQATISRDLKATPTTEPRRKARKQQSKPVAMRPQQRGVIVTPSGTFEIKSGNYNPLFDWFHGINNGDLIYGDNLPGYANAYATSVWMYKCINARATTFGGIEWQVHNGAEEVIADKQNPLVQMFDKRNRVIKRLIEYDRMVFGMAFLRPVEYAPRRWWLKRYNPQMIEIEYDGDRGISEFVLRVDGTTAHRFAPDELVYLPLYNPMYDFEPLSPARICLQSLKIDAAAWTFVTKFFENDATPSFLLKTEQGLPDGFAKRMLDDWEEDHRGVSNSHRPRLLERGLEVQQLGSPLKDLVIADLDDRTVRRICAIFSVPPTMAGITDAQAYATADNERKSFYTETILPETDAVLDELNLQLVPMIEGMDGFEVVANSDDIEALQEDRIELTDRASKSFAAGYSSFNDARELEGLDRVEGGDFYVIGGQIVVKEAIESGSIVKPIVDSSATYSQVATYTNGVASLNEARAKQQLEPVPIDIFVLPNMGIVTRADLEAGKLPGVVGGFGGGFSGGFGNRPDQQQLNDQQAALGLPSGQNSAMTPPAKAVPMTIEVTKQAVHSQALQDLARWETKSCKKGVSAAFETKFIPSAVQAFIRMELKSLADPTPENITAVFAHFKPMFKAEDTEDLATPEEFEQFWQNIDSVFNELSGVFLDSWQGLPDAIATHLRAGETDIAPLLEQQAAALVDQLAGTEQDPGLLTQIFLAGGARGNDLLTTHKSYKAGGIGISWDVVNREAVEWARRYAGELVRGINDTTQDILQQTVSSWIDGGGSLANLAAAIEGQLEGLDIPAGWSPGKIVWATSPQRAALIAQTESTRSFAEGVTTRWNQLGVKRFKWRTANDARVCPLCMRLNNKEGEIGKGVYDELSGQFYTPPAHVGCRCPMAAVL